MLPQKITGSVGGGGVSRYSRSVRRFVAAFVEGRGCGVVDLFFYSIITACSCVVRLRMIWLDLPQMPG